MRLRSLLSVGCVLSSLTAAELKAENLGSIVPPAPAAQSETAGEEAQLTPVAEVFQPAADPIESEENPQPETLNETEESEDQIIFDDPSPVKPPADPYKPLFFDNTFGSYLSNPNHPWLLGERLKEMPLGDECSPYTLSVGGELRHRWMHEQNRLRPGGPVNTDYNLWRWRQYFDLHISDFARVYFEGIDASIFDNDLPPTPIDINRWNVQNAFVDVKLHEWDGAPGWFRYGRQEMLYGSQHLISPLDWSNTRRNFEGFKYFHHTDSVHFDAFITNPVNAAAGNQPLSRYDNGRDKPDTSVTFSGIYMTFLDAGPELIDLYYLWLRDETNTPNRPDGSRHTLGGRYKNSWEVQNECCQVTRIWDFETEGAY
ncbi:MAG: alginate export family protein, partial [Gimesia chilikensis]